MTGALRFPFRLSPSGEVTCASYGSDQEVNDAIAAITLTDIGERPLSPGFGITDPVGLAINDVDMSADIQSALSTYGFEDVTVTTADIVPAGEGQAMVEVQWERDEPEVSPLEEEDDE